MRKLLLFTSALIITGCSGTPAGNMSNAQYWQRVSASDATYTRGPKAQQMLHRDISHCVVELRELERMGAIKDAIPANNMGRVNDPDPHVSKMAAFDTPERDGDLLMEQSDYYDFEGCMYAKGWERVAHLPFDVALKSRDDYLRGLEDYKFQSTYSKSKPRTQADGAYYDLNN